MISIEYQKNTQLSLNVLNSSHQWNVLILWKTNLYSPIHCTANSIFKLSSTSSLDSRLSSLAVPKIYTFAEHGNQKHEIERKEKQQPRIKCATNSESDTGREQNPIDDDDDYEVGRRNPEAHAAQTTIKIGSQHNKSKSMQTASSNSSSPTTMMTNIHAEFSQWTNERTNEKELSFQINF